MMYLSMTIRNGKVRRLCQRLSRLCTGGGNGSIQCGYCRLIIWAMHIVIDRSIWRNDYKSRKPCEGSKSSIFIRSRRCYTSSACTDSWEGQVIGNEIIEDDRI